MPPNAQEEFLKSLEVQPTDPFDSINPPETIVEGDGTTVVTDDEKKDEDDKTNRRERRLTAKLQAERESSIALASRLAALEDARKAREDQEPAEYAKTIERIFGTGTPEAAEATELLKSSLKGVEERATTRAMDMFREERLKEEQKVADEEKNLDSMVEDIEDEIGKDIDAPTRKGFFQMLEKLSPKDKDGNIIAYADHFAVWDELQARTKKVDIQTDRAKDLAARSIQRSGASPQTSAVDEATERYLLENGII